MAKLFLNLLRKFGAIKSNAKVVYFGAKETEQKQFKVFGANAVDATSLGLRADWCQPCYGAGQSRRRHAQLQCRSHLAQSAKSDFEIILPAVEY
jgi:hypothetical protein